MEETGLSKTANLRRQLEENRRSCLSRLKPEECASWEQLQLGLAQLHQAGIYKVAKSEVSKIHEAFEMLKRLYHLRKSSHLALANETKTKSAPFPVDATRQLAAYRYVLYELNLTPWYLSYCFYWLHLHAETQSLHFPLGTVMKIIGLGDPSGSGFMVSYLPSFDMVRKNHGGDDKSAAAASANEVDMYVESEKKRQKKKQVAPEDVPKYGGDGKRLANCQDGAVGRDSRRLALPR
jgi:hypothetical protein